MLVFKGMSTEQAELLRKGGADAYGNIAERTISDSSGNNCRHCLGMIDPDEDMLICAYRPFKGINPYTETGPIFLHANTCPAFQSDALPPALHACDEVLMRGYDLNERIVYGTGQIVRTDQLLSLAHKLLENEELEFLHLRSATNNCWTARLENI